MSSGSTPVPSSDALRTLCEYASKPSVARAMNSLCSRPSARITDAIALSNAMASVILAEGLEHKEFIARATDGFDAYSQSVRSASLDGTGVDPELIRRVARDYASAKNAMICWTLGI